MELRPILPHNPMSAAIRQRGTVTHIFTQLVDTLAVGEEDESLSRADPDEAPGIAPPKKASMASPRMIQEPSGEDTRSRVLPRDILEPRCGSAGRDRATEGGDNFRAPGAEGSSDQKSRGQNPLRILGVFSHQVQRPSGRGWDGIIEGANFPTAEAPREEMVTFIKVGTSATSSP